MTIEKNDNEFSLYYTDAGLTSVSGEVELEIMELLRSENLTLAEISKIIDLPISTILFNIVKLEERRVIASYRDSEDRRKVHYTIISHKFLKSMKPYTDSEEYRRSVLTRMISDSTYTYRGLLEFVTIKCASFGIDLGNMLERGGILFGYLMRDNFIPGDIQHLQQYLEKYFADSNTPHIFGESNDPVTINVSLTDEKLKNYDMDLTHKFHLGVICSALKQVMGERYAVTSTVVEKETKKVVYTIEPVPELKTVSNDLYLPNGLIKVRGEDDPEMICILPGNDGYPRIVNNPNQIEILKSLERSPKALKALNNEIPGPQSTLFSNLTKLEKAGIIYIDRNSLGSNQYRTYGPILLQRNDHNTEHTDVVVKIFKKAIQDPSYYFNAILKYVMLIFDATGIDTTRMHLEIGKELADVIMQHSDKGADQMIKDLSNDFLPNASLLNIESFIPLTITVHTPMFTKIGGISIMNFYAGMVSEFIFAKTGRMYEITSVNQYQDGGVHAIRFSLEPKIA